MSFIRIQARQGEDISAEETERLIKSESSRRRDRRRRSPSRKVSVPSASLTNFLASWFAGVIHFRKRARTLCLLSSETESRRNIRRFLSEEMFN